MGTPMLMRLPQEIGLGLARRRIILSRNSATLRCPKCGHTFTQDCLAFSPVCPNCTYCRGGQDDQPKFIIVNEPIRPPVRDGDLP